MKKKKQTKERRKERKNIEKKSAGNQGKKLEVKNEKDFKWGNGLVNNNKEVMMRKSVYVTIFFSGKLFESWVSKETFTWKRQEYVFKEGIARGKYCARKKIKVFGNSKGRQEQMWKRNLK